MRLAQIVYAARDTNVYTFTPLEGATLPPAEAGAHIDLFLRPNLIRQYSLLQPAPAPRAYVVGVKKDAAGRGGSRYIHDQLRVGDEVEVSAPRNNFPLREDAEHSVLLAGGIGITPIWAMVQRLQELGKSWRMWASNRSRQDTALLEQLTAIDNVALHFDDEAGGFIDLVSIIAQAPANTHFYCCGPALMLAAYRAAAAHLPAQFVHDEAFSVAPPPPGGDSDFVVRLARSGRDIPIAADKSILDTLRENGLNLFSSCEAGVCGTCETRVIEGEIDHRDHVLSSEEQAENSRMMICCSRAKSPVLVLDI